MSCGADEATGGTGKASTGGEATGGAGTGTSAGADAGGNGGVGGSISNLAGRAGSAATGRGGASPDGAGAAGESSDGWEATPSLPNCTLATALDPAKEWPGLSFEPAGRGISVAQPKFGERPLLGAELGSSLRNVNGKARLSTSLRFTDERRHLWTILDADTGVPELLISSSGPECYGQLGSIYSPQLFINFDMVADLRQYGWVAPGADSATWLPANTLHVGLTFDTGERWGGIVDLASVRITTTPTVAEVHEVYVSGALVRAPVGWNGDLYLTEGVENQGRILRLSRDDELTEVATGDYFPVSLAVSDQWLVWVGAEGNEATDGLFDRARLFGCALPGEGEDCAAKPLAELPIASAAGPLVVSEHWAALSGCSTTECWSLLVDLSSGDVYRLDEPDGITTNYMLGFGDEALYVQGWDAASYRTADFSHFVRYDLETLPLDSQRL